TPCGCIGRAVSRDGHAGVSFARLVGVTLLAGCRTNDPLSLVSACLSTAVGSGTNPRAELKCSVEQPIELVLVPRAPVTENDLIDAGVPANQAKLLFSTGQEGPRLCTVHLSGPPAPPPASSDMTVSVGDSECVVLPFEVGHPLIAQGRDFSFMFGHTNGRPLLVGVKSS